MERGGHIVSVTGVNILLEREVTAWKLDTSFSFSSVAQYIWGRCLDYCSVAQVPRVQDCLPTCFVRVRVRVCVHMCVLVRVCACACM